MIPPEVRVTPLHGPRGRRGSIVPGPPRSTSVDVTPGLRQAFCQVEGFSNPSNMHVSLSAPGQSDAALMTAVAEGSMSALATLYERYGEAAHRTAYRITGSVTDAEDVVHDVFVGLPDAARRYSEQGRLAGWMKTLVARTALLRLRRRSAYDRVLFDYVSVDWTGDRADPMDLLAMRAALKVMPEKLRLVFTLKEIEGYDHAEIADLLAITVAASRVRLHRAWLFLRNRLGVR